MSQCIVVPDVPIESVSDEMMQHLCVIWRAARDDVGAFHVVLTGLDRGLTFELYKHHDLVIAILSLQPNRNLETYQRPSACRLTSDQIASFLYFISSATWLVLFFLGTYMTSSHPNDVDARFASLPSVVRLALGSFPPLDAYTVQILQGLWDIAVAAPTCLDDYVQGRSTADRSRLVWSLWKLKRNGVFRIRDVGTSPVELLPEEVLALIFKVLRVSPPFHYISDNHEPNRHDVASHLPVRLVCKRWYNVIDNTPNLWAPMNLRFGFDWTVRALSKSKPEALDVEVRARTPEGAISPALMMNLAEFQRIRTLTIRSPLDALEIVSHHIQSSPAPLLQTLKLEPTEDGSPGPPLDGGSFLGRPPPLLSNVNLAQWSVNPACPIFLSPLVTLDLTCCAVWQSLDSLIVTLRALPSLERFQWSMSQNALRNLGMSFRFPAEAFLQSEQPHAPLLHLNQLELELPIACIAAIMAHIIIPASCTLNVLDDYSFPGVPDDTVTNDVYQALDASVGAHLQRLLSDDTGLHIDSLYVCEDGEAEPGRGALHLEGSSGRSHVFGLSFIVADVIQGEIGADVLLGVLRHIFAWPVFGDTITYLLTNHEVMAVTELWAMVLDVLPTITTLVIEETAHSDPSGAVGGLARSILQRVGRAQQLSCLTLAHLHLRSELIQLLVTAIDIRHRRSPSPLTLIMHSCTGLERNDEALLDEVVRRSGGRLQVNTYPIRRIDTT